MNISLGQRPMLLMMFAWLTFISSRIIKLDIHGYFHQ
jgi:hypothetical protein